MCNRSTCCTLLTFFLALLVGTTQTAGQDCTTISSSYRLAVVSIIVEFQHEDNGDKPKSHGTGFIISSDGYLLTAKHVVEAPTKHVIRSITGTLGDFEAPAIPIRFVENDPVNDIAILQFQVTNQPYSTVPLGNARDVKPGNNLCSLSFSKPYNEDYHPAEGIHTGKNGDLWVTQMPSNDGESGGPVFRVSTGRVVAIKLGTIKRETEEHIELINYLTPINLATRLKDIHVPDIYIGDKPPSDIAPVLLCTEKAPEAHSPVQIRLDTECNGCVPKSNTKTNWQATPFSLKSQWSTGNQSWLGTKSEASVELKCKKRNEKYLLEITTQHSALAGWGGVEGDYRYSDSTIEGSAETGFTLAESERYCMAIKSFTQEETRRKGYPNSANFQETGSTPSLISLDTPNGEQVELRSGSSIPLEEFGKWRFLVAVRTSLRSERAEDSGFIFMKNSLEFQFTRKLPDGGCPVF